MIVSRVAYQTKELFEMITTTYLIFESIFLAKMSSGSEGQCTGLLVSPLLGVLSVQSVQ